MFSWQVLGDEQFQCGRSHHDVEDLVITATASSRGTASGVVEGNAVPPLFSEGERDPSLFCSISGIFSAEINEQRRLQDSQFLQMLTSATELLTYWSRSQFRRYIMLQITNSYV